MVFCHGLCQKLSEKSPGKFCRAKFSGIFMQKNVSRWQNVFIIADGKILLNAFKDVENLIDLFDERYTKSVITDDEFGTDVKKIASNNN